MTLFRFKPLFLGIMATLFLVRGLGVQAQTCQTSTDMDDASRSSLSAAGQRYFEKVVRGDTPALHQDSIPSVAADFSGIESSVKAHQSDLAGSKPSPRPMFLLDASGTAVLPHAEFFCGVFGKSGQTANSAVFYLNNLPPGKYGVVILDATGARAPSTVSLVLQQAGNDWRLGGLYIKSLQLAGHDSEWFAARAREYKARGQLHNSWLYYHAAIGVVSPLDFMSTAASDKLLDEAQSVKPADFPQERKTTDLVAGGVSYTLTAVFPQAVGNDVDLCLTYSAADISNTNQTYANNVAVMKSVVAKYPELKDAFAAMVARAVDPAGHDYGTLLAMKDLK